MAEESQVVIMLINLCSLLIADHVYPLPVQHDRGERHNIRQTSARRQSHPTGGVAPGEGKRSGVGVRWCLLWS